MRRFILAAAFVTTVSCATRAPSTNELDRKAGLSPTLDAEVAKSEARELRKSGNEKTKRTPPRVEKVWVYGRELSPSVFMQGTHVFLEVTPSSWTSEEGGAR